MSKQYCSWFILHKTTARDTVRGGYSSHLLILKTSAPFSPCLISPLTMWEILLTLLQQTEEFIFPNFFFLFSNFLAFFMHAKIHLSQRGEEMKLRYCNAKLCFKGLHILSIGQHLCICFTLYETDGMHVQLFQFGKYFHECNSN